jgi:acetyltransferase-like isoleucine patch superfamily enzyme
MLRRNDRLPVTRGERIRSLVWTRYHRIAGDLVHRAQRHLEEVGVVGPHSRVAAEFGTFGDGSVLCYPAITAVNPSSIHIGKNTLVGRQVVLSAGWGPNHVGLPDRVLSIGDRCVIGRNSTIVAHRSIEIGDDVWTGHQVFITDGNHTFDDLETPIHTQLIEERPIRIGAHSWIGHGVVILPGVTIGRHSVVGAGSVVTRDVPDFCVAVGAPARVVHRMEAPGAQAARAGAAPPA